MAILSKPLNSVTAVTIQPTKMATGHVIKIHIVAANGHAAWEISLGQPFADDS